MSVNIQPGDLLRMHGEDLPDSSAFFTSANPEGIRRGRVIAIGKDEYDLWIFVNLDQLTIDRLNPGSFEYFYEIVEKHAFDEGQLRYFEMFCPRLCPDSEDHEVAEEARTRAEDAARNEERAGLQREYEDERWVREQGKDYH